MDEEIMKQFAMSDIGLTEDEADLAVEEFVADEEQPLVACSLWGRQELTSTDFDTSTILLFSSHSI